jgi:hypothetical protein
VQIFFNFLLDALDVIIQLSEEGILGGRQVFCGAFEGQG